MDEQLAFAMYKPKPGNAEKLIEILQDHMPTLQRLGLKTVKPGYVVQSSDGTVIEIFEWVSEEAKRIAHRHPEVTPIWERMMGICDFPAMKDLPESVKSFPSFTVIK